MAFAVPSIDTVVADTGDGGIATPGVVPGVALETTLGAAAAVSVDARLALGTGVLAHETTLMATTTGNQAFNDFATLFG